MRLEHVGMLVSDAMAVAEWYRVHLGFEIVRAGSGPVATGAFVTDEGRTVMLELISHKELAAPDYPAMPPLQLHLAFATQTPDEDRERLVKAGATFVEETPMNTPGDKLYLLRDPWGMPLQLIKRGAPLL